MDPEQARHRFGAQRIARLATVRPDGSPHVVPVTFALDGDTLYTAVDAKPKRSRNLQRLANLTAEPRCAFLVDHYADDWSQLWWVRADAVAEVVDMPDAGHPGIESLAGRYASYAASRPAGPLIVATVVRWRGWSATS